MIKEVIKNVHMPAVEFTYSPDLTNEEFQKLREKMDKFGIKLSKCDNEIHFVDTWETAIDAMYAFNSVRVLAYAQAYDELGNPIFNFNN